MTRTAPLTAVAHARMVRLLLEDGPLVLRLTQEWVNGDTPIEASYSGYAPLTLNPKQWAAKESGWLYPEQVFPLVRDLTTPAVLVGYYVTNKAGILMQTIIEPVTLRWAGDALAVTIGLD